MRKIRFTVVLALAATALGAAPILAASDYSEGWDTGTVAGWARATISCEVFGDGSGGNPGGSLRIAPDNTSIALIGALTQLPEATGDYAAAGIRRVSFDLKNESVPVSQLWFRVRYLDEFHNGWLFTLASSVANGSWTSYVIEFDPTWSDAEAIAAGWQQEPNSAPFATTMSAVYYPSVQMRAGPATPGAQLRLDNFRLVSCSNDTEAPEGSVTVDRDALWPPNHKLVDVFAFVQSADFCDAHPTVKLASVTSDEPDEGLGNGDKPGDIEIVSDFSFRLRAERDTHGDGREYTITYDVVDASGNATSVSAVVSVPVNLSAGVLVATGGTVGDGLFLSDSGNLILFVPSRPGFDPLQIDPARAQVGNHLGVVPVATSYRSDVNGDRRDDLALVFPLSNVENLSLRARAEPMEESGCKDCLPADDSLVSLHFDLGGKSYLVDDILSRKRSSRLPSWDVGGGEEDPGAAVETDKTSTLGGPGNTLLTVAEPGHMEVFVFNVLGRKVRTLIDRELNTGLVPLAWDGRDDGGRSVPSGMYFVRISGAGFNEVRKVHLAR